MKKENKKMTIEKLATLVTKGFERSETNLTELAAMTARGFEQVDKRFEQVDRRFEQVDKKFEQVDRRFDHLENRIDGLELKVSATASSWAYDFDRLYDRLMELDGRINQLEDKVIGR